MYICENFLKWSYLISALKGKLRIVLKGKRRIVFQKRNTKGVL